MASDDSAAAAAAAAAVPVARNLFDYTQEELLDEHVLTHYEVLNVPVHATPDQVKKAYRKCSLKYHPDKTNRGEDDYVFLAVKAAYDTLLDPVKRQGYDSTVLPFDDSIPAARSVMMQDASLLYTDDDFYETFGPVFALNLRFDARLRPDLKKGSAGGSGNGSNGNKRQAKGNNNSQKGNSEPPSLGDASTPLEEVNAFYDYWIHFESWRDFSAQAADELQVENELENAESRFEKRWIQKEIDRRAKQLKRTEMARLQTLVERAMEADPRLRLHRQNQVLAKEQAAAERERLKNQERLAAQAAAEQAAADELADKERKAAEKIVRDQEKKLLRKARQALRKMASASFESFNSNNNDFTNGEEANDNSERPSPQLWNDSYDMQQDVEYLCTNLSLEELNQLNEDFETAGLPLVHQLTLELKDRNEKTIQKPSSLAATSAGATSNASASTAAIPWSAMELSALAKAVKRYPAGGASRWDAITAQINASCRPETPRTREACIEKYNQIARSKGPTSSATGAPPSVAAATLGPSSSSTPPMTNGHVDAATSNGAPTDAATASFDTATDGDNWTPEQDKLFQDALSKYPASMDKNERWAAIAAAVPGQTKKSCVQRFKAIREVLLSKNKK